VPLRGWLGFEGGSLRGEGVALADAKIGSGRWVAITTGVDVGWPIAPRLRLIGSFEIAVPFARTRFALANGTGIYEPSPGSARCALGFEAGWR
jgi:hypothetical protein